MLYVITANVSKDYGYASAVIGVTDTFEKAEELVDSIYNPEYSICSKQIDGYVIMKPQIIEVEELNTLCVCLSDDGLDYSDD